MAFLTVAGTALRCSRSEWNEEPPETQGETSRMADGSLGSTERNPKRVFQGPVVFPTTADAAAFRVAISVTGAPGVPKEVTATSDAAGLLAGDSVQVYARLGALRAVKYQDGLYWKGPLRLVEV